MEFIIKNEAALRFGVFVGLTAFMGLLEVIIPRRKQAQSKPVRWFTNFGIVGIDVLAVRLFMPVLPITVALWAEANGFGLLNLFAIPFPVQLIVTIVLLDLLIYTQHWAFHVIPFFWRFHKVHHTDMELDVSSGFRFHPIEIIMSLGIKMAAVALLGASALGVVLFEIALNVTSLFHHGNIKLPNKLDATIRWVFVTPDVHRIHHSVIPSETDSNFGFSVTLWDRLFKTYKAEPKQGQLGMTIGLKEYQDPKKVTLLQLLVIPFKSTQKPANHNDGSRLGSKNVGT